MKAGRIGADGFILDIVSYPDGMLIPLPPGYEELPFGVQIDRDYRQGAEWKALTEAEIINRQNRPMNGVWDHELKNWVVPEKLPN